MPTRLPRRLLRMKTMSLSEGGIRFPVLEDGLGWSFSLLLLSLQLPTYLSFFLNP